MAANSSIEWTDSTWNPVTGCTKVSTGCKYCYAEAMTKRFENQWGPFSEIKEHPARLSVPLKRRSPTIFFVNSMSDLFHERVSDEFILRVFEVMNNSDRHTFQVLTKRPNRLLELNQKLRWTPNIWMGVSIENRAAYERISLLRSCDAQTKFLSVEPLLEDLFDINLKGLDWVIVGGESGRRARPMEKSWVVRIRKECRRMGVPFFFKQWGGTNKKETGRLLDGKVYNSMPLMQPQKSIFVSPQTNSGRRIASAR